MKFIRRSLLVAILGGPLAFAQGSDYLGPEVASSGAGTIGQRSGQDLGLQMFGGVDAIRDTGLLPLATDADGRLAKVQPLDGVEASLGAYGSHSWKRLKLGLDYHGGYRRYEQSSTYGGANQTLALGVTYQESRRIVIDSQLSAASVNQGTQLIGAGEGIVDSVAGPTSVLFDNRYSMVQGSSDVNYIASSRTVYSFGGTGYTIHRGTSALAGVNGYTLRGTIKHNIARDTTLSVGYQHTHYDYPRAFGDADINQYTGGISKKFGREWEVSLSGGVYSIQTEGVQSVAVDPAIAALLGTKTTTQTFYSSSLLPTVTAGLTRTFRRGIWASNYSRGITPGNGLYLASQQESYGSSFRYTGIRKWAFTIGGSKSSLQSVAQQLVTYSTYGGNIGISRSLPAGLNLGAEFELRNQQLAGAVFNRTATRTSINLSYTPGDVPISFH